MRKVIRRPADNSGDMKRPRRTPAESGKNAASEAADQTVILVRRGALRRYDALKRKTAELPVHIDWDRRVQERRDAARAGAPDERRGADRRQAPPFTWDLADFVVVPGASTDVPAAVQEPARKARKTPVRAAARKAPAAKRTSRTRKAPSGRR